MNLYNVVFSEVEMADEKRKAARLAADSACAALAEAHCGIVARDQAAKAGLSSSAIYRRVQAGRWIEVLPGVYRVAGAPETWLQKVTAACLWAGRGVAVSHRSAAALWELPGFGEGPVEVSTERAVHGVDGVVVHRVRFLPKTEVEVRAHLPVTSATRTLMDLGAVATPEQVEEALEDALRRRLTDLPLLQLRLGAEGKRGRRGAGVLRAFVEEREAGYQPTESVFETKLRRVLRAGKLPPVQQHKVRDGRRTLRVDFAYPDAMVALEADSRRFHFSAADFERGNARRNALTRLGWRVLTVSWADLKNGPDKVVAELRQTLSRARQGQ
jgi:very-short-patch-repair endonuclease